MREVFDKIKVAERTRQKTCHTNGWSISCQSEVYADFPNEFQPRRGVFHKMAKGGGTKGGFSKKNALERP